MGLHLFFLPNFPGAMFIQGATFIPDSRVTSPYGSYQSVRIECKICNLKNDIILKPLGEHKASSERTRSDHDRSSHDRRRTSKKNQASPGIFFDPETGKFKRGNPPPDLVVKSQQIREEVKQTTNLQRELPFAKFTSENNKDHYSHRYVLFFLPPKVYR